MIVECHACEARVDGRIIAEHSSHELLRGTAADRQRLALRLLRRLNEVWKPKLSSERIGSLDLGEAAEVLLRFTASRMKPAWLDLLGKYESYPHLRSGLDEDEKDALRELRNLGVGRHDGRWLFTPTPSSKFEPADAGTFLLRLYHGDPPDSELLRSYFKQIVAIARERANREVLEKISREGKFPPQRRDKVRELRRMGLVEHESYYLANTDRATLTALGLHVLHRL